MKKIIAMLLVLVMSVTGLVGCGSSKDNEAGSTSASSDSDWAYIQDKGKLTVGITLFAPMNYYNEKNKLVGFDTEMAEAVTKKLGIDVEFTEINWDSKEVELSSKNIDCIWNGFTINGREDDYTWSDPYINNEQVIVVAKDSGIEKLADLKGKNVVVQAASAALDALNNDDNKDLKDSFASLTENPDYNTAFMNIDSGAADAVAVDIGVANYQLSQRGKDKYVILDEPIQNEQYGIGFKKGNDELKDLVWDEVKKLDESGEVDKLADKYELDKSMLCISEDKEDSDSDSTEADTEESADSTEKEADSESK